VKSELKYIISSLLFILLITPLYPRGTEAGTLISNHADITYIMASKERNSSSNIDEFVIDRIIDLDISWQDTAHVLVGSGDKGVILTFMLTNLGNGEDTFALSYEHNDTDSFDPPPENIHIYLDTDGSSIFDISKDVEVTDDINISADHNVTLFVVADIPNANDTNYSDSELSHDGISAESQSQPDETPDAPELVDIVSRRSLDMAMGVYEIREFWFESIKSVQVISDDNQTHTGSILHYTIILKLIGETDGKSVNSVVVTDKIPDGSSYLADSLRLDGKLFTDVEDGDNGDINSTHIRVAVGEVAGDDNHTVEFDVMVD